MELVAAYSLWIGVASVVLAVVGFGRLAKSVPSSVRHGFKWGCAVGVMVAAIPNGFFLKGTKDLNSAVASSSLVSDLIAPLKGNFPGAVSVTGPLFALSHPWLWGLAPAFMFVFGTGFMMDSKRYLPSFLPPGTEVILVTALDVLQCLHEIRRRCRGRNLGDGPRCGFFCFGSAYTC